MTSFPTFLLALAVWSSAGVTIAWFLRRQGHNVGIYIGLAALFGPLVALFARRVSAESTKAVIDLANIPGSGISHQSTGWLHVLVGLDGSDEAIDSVAQVIDLLRPAVARLRIVTVIDVESANAPSHYGIDDELAPYLRAGAERFGVADTETALLAGRADEALAEHAQSEGVDLLVVAHRRHPVLSGLVGSTVARLTKHSSGPSVPVVVGPPARSVPVGDRRSHVRSSVRSTRISEKGSRRVS